MSSDAFLHLPPLRGPAGNLEFACAAPAGPPQMLCVICHPHSLYGGSMSNKVVTTLERVLHFLATPP